MADYDPPAMNTLLTESLSSLNPARRLAVYGRMLKMVATDVPYVPLFVQDANLALSSGYAFRGYTQWSSLGPWELDLRHN